MTLCNCCRLSSALCNILDTMSQMLLLLSAAVIAVSARPSPGGLDVEPGSPQPYQYQYEVNVPETGDQKSHTEERDETGVVVGNFQVVDPNGDLRKLFYRVEGNSGFVITDQQVMRGFADPPPAPETYSRRQSTQDDFQGGDDGGQLGLLSDDGAGASSDQSSAGDGGQFGDGAGSSSGNGGNGGVFGFNNFASSSGGSSSSEEGSSSPGESGGSSEGGDSLEGGSSGGGSSGESSSSEGELSGGQQLLTSGVSGTDGQNAQTGSSQPIASQTSEVKQVKKVKPFEFHGPAFTFSIQRTEPNRFEVKEKIIGHEVEFNTHGGRIRRFAAYP